MVLNFCYSFFQNGVGNGVMIANKVAMMNQCNIEIIEDSSGSDSEVEALLMGKTTKFTANFPSPTVISNVVRSMWNVSNAIFIIS